MIEAVYGHRCIGGLDGSLYSDGAVSIASDGTG